MRFIAASFAFVLSTALVGHVYAEPLGSPSTRAASSQARSTSHHPVASSTARKHDTKSKPAVAQRRPGSSPGKNRAATTVQAPAASMSRPAQEPAPRVSSPTPEERSVIIPPFQPPAASMTRPIEEPPPPPRVAPPSPTKKPLPPLPAKRTKEARKTHTRHRDRITEKSI